SLARRRQRHDRRDDRGYRRCLPRRRFLPARGHRGHRRPGPRPGSARRRTARPARWIRKRAAMSKPVLNSLLFAGEAIVDLLMWVPALHERGGDMLADAAAVAVGGGFTVMAAAAGQRLP